MQCRTRALCIEGCCRSGKILTRRLKASSRDWGRRAHLVNYKMEIMYIKINKNGFEFCISPKFIRALIIIGIAFEFLG